MYGDMEMIKYTRGSNTPYNLPNDKVVLSFPYYSSELKVTMNDVKKGWRLPYGPGSINIGPTILSTWSK